MRKTSLVLFLAILTGCFHKQTLEKDNVEHLSWGLTSGDPQAPANAVATQQTASAQADSVRALSAASAEYTRAQAATFRVETTEDIEKAYLTENAKRERNHAMVDSLQSLIKLELESPAPDLARVQMAREVLNEELENTRDPGKLQALDELLKLKRGGSGGVVGGGVAPSAPTPPNAPGVPGAIPGSPQVDPTPVPPSPQPAVGPGLPPSPPGLHNLVLVNDTNRKLRYVGKPLHGKNRSFVVNIATQSWNYVLVASGPYYIDAYDENGDFVRGVRLDIDDVKNNAPVSAIGVAADAAWSSQVVTFR